MGEEDTVQSGGLNLKNPDMKTSYANFSHVYVNATDVYLYFGIQDGEGAIEDVNVDNRIIVTHDSFMRMMEFWSTRYSTLKAIYGDYPRNLHDFDQEIVRNAFISELGLKKEDE